jgi:hypothetical protein
VPDDAELWQQAALFVPENEEVVAALASSCRMILWSWGPPARPSPPDLC